MNQTQFRKITFSNRPDRVSQLAEHWVSIPKVVGSIPTVIRHIFQLAQCRYRLRMTPQTSFLPEYITPEDKIKVINIFV